MEQTRLVSPHSFCWNPNCSEYGILNPDNVRKNGRTRKGTQRYQCKTCLKTFVATMGTVFYGRHHSQETILESLAMLAERNSLAAVRRVKGVKEDTLIEWRRAAAQHVEPIEALLLANYQLSRAQLDALWTYVGHKGEKGATGKRQSAAPSGAGPR